MNEEAFNEKVSREPVRTRTLKSEHPSVGTMAPQGRWYSWPSPPPSKKYVPDYQRSRIVPNPASGKPHPNRQPPAQRGFWAPVPGGAWRKGPRGLRFIPARNEPSGWHDPKKRLAFAATPPQDKENAVKQPSAAPQQQQPARKAFSNAGYALNGMRPAAVKPLNNISNLAAATPAAPPARPSARPKPAQYGGGQCNYSVYEGRAYNYNGTYQGFNGLQYVPAAAAPAAYHAGNRRPQFNPAAARAPAPALAPAPSGLPPQPQIQARPKPSYFGSQQAWPAERKAWAPVAPFPPAQPIPQPGKAVNSDDGSMCSIM